MLDTAYCVCVTSKTKTKMQMIGKFAHNMRLYTPKNADPSKRDQNELLIGDPSLNGVFDITVEEAKNQQLNHKYKTYQDSIDDTKWMVEQATNHKVRKDAVLGIELVLTYTSADNHNVPIDEWKKKNVEWLQEYFGSDNVISAVLHMDETTPHIHAMVTPIDRESGQPKFNAKKWLGGWRLMNQMQTDYAKAMEEFGLQRGEVNSKAEHEDLTTFYHALNNVVRQKLPEREQFQDQHSYQEAIDEIYRETVIRMFALEQSIKRLEAVDKTRESNHSIYRDITEAKITDYEKTISMLQSDLSDAEKKVQLVDRMQTAISAIEKDDPKQADTIRENLNKLSRKGGALERALERQKNSLDDKDNDR